MTVGGVEDPGGGPQVAASGAVLVTGALLLTMIAIEFLAGRLTLRDTVFGAGLRGRSRDSKDATD